MKIAFDFDGTLVDSMPALRNAAVNLISETYKKSYAQSDVWYMATIGRSFREQIDFLFRGESLNEFVAQKFHEEHMKIYKKVGLHSGVVETIDYLNEQEIPYVVCSSSPQDLVSATIERLLPEFRGQLLSQEVSSKREQLRESNPSDFIGDTLYDCIVAQKLGIRFTGVSHTLPLDDVKRLGAPVTDSIPLAVDLIVNPDAVPLAASQELR